MITLTNVKSAMKYVVDKYGGVVEAPYIDRVNENFHGKVVGYRFRLKGKGYLVTFRPRGVTSFTKVGHGAMTLMNLSEIVAQVRENRDRMIVFQEKEKVRIYVFPTEEIVKFVVDNYDPKTDFKDYPSESEKCFNIPISIAVNINLLVDEK